MLVIENARHTLANLLQNPYVLDINGIAKYVDCLRKREKLFNLFINGELNDINELNDCIHHTEIQKLSNSIVRKKFIIKRFLSKFCFVENLHNIFKTTTRFQQTT